MRPNPSIAAFFALAISFVILLWPALSTAQENPPAVPLSPTPVFPEISGEPVVRLPFGDTFDSAWGWSPTGSWAFDPANGFDGSGWYVDGAQRETLSILEYTSLIDLAGTLSAQLVYRQKGALPASDFVAADLSLDGGSTWFMVDQQIGVAADWELHVVDLTLYRGQVVRLRFRVGTGVQMAEPDPEVSSGYWLDNVTIQFVSVQPTLVFAPADTGPRTLMGLHLIVGARKEPILDLVRRLRATGWPLGTIKGTSGTEEILNEVKVLSPETVVVYRSLKTLGGTVDCPNASNDPTAEAQVWYAGLQPFWQAIQADYYEIMNECQPPPEWLATFSIEMMRQAGLRGQCLLLFSFSTGNPEPSVFSALLPVYEFALQNPCQPGRYHGIALHAYGVNKTTLVSESGISLGFRHRLFYTTVLSQNPAAIQIPVYITEAGPGDGSTDFRCEDVTRDVILYSQQLEYDPYVRGFHLWTLGPDQGPWTDVTPCLPMIGDALVGYYAGKPR